MKKTVYFIVLLFVVSCATSEYIPKIKGIKVDAKTYNSVGQNERVKFLVMHYTVADYPTSIRILTQQQVSSHYLVGDIANENKVYQLVREDKRAWHAGVSYWQGRENLNDMSIGIEIVNKGFVEKDSVRHFFPFDGQQMKKVALLMQSIIERHNIKPTAVVGHSDIAPGRKQDPGPLFPWKILYKKYGIGAWYDDNTALKYIEPYYENVQDTTFVRSVQKDFARYGYKIEETGEWDKMTADVILSFQYHFRPSLCDGILDAETYAILQALLEKYNR